MGGQDPQGNQRLRGAGADHEEGPCVRQEVGALAALAGSGQVLGGVRLLARSEFSSAGTPLSSGQAPRDSSDAWRSQLFESPATQLAGLRAGRPSQQAELA